MRRSSRFEAAVAAVAVTVAVALVAGAGVASGAPRTFVPDRPAIINGAPTSAANFTTRWGAIAAVVASSSGSLSLCGGALIDERMVLTAAHCTYGPLGTALAPSAFDVVVGRRVASTTEGDTIPVSSVTRHPQFSRVTMRNDIAVLRLSRAPLVAVTPITPTSAADEAWWGAGLGLAAGGDAVGPWIAGWGAVNGAATLFPAELQEAKVPIAADSVCAAAGPPGHGSNFDDSSMLCAGVPGTSTGTGVDSCQGDSGGPLIVGDGLGGLRLVGLTSWGLDCGGRYFGVYTRVGRYATWIEGLRFQPSPTVPGDTAPPVVTPPQGSTPAPPQGGAPDGSGGGTGSGAGSGAVPDAGAGQAQGAGGGGGAAASGGPVPSESVIGPIVLPAVGAKAGTPPTRPTMFRVAARGRGWVRVAWRACKDDGRVIGYRVLWKSRTGWRVVRVTRATSLVIRVPRGHATRIRVQSIDDAGQRSRPSGILAVRPR